MEAVRRQVRERRIDARERAPLHEGLEHDLPLGDQSQDLREVPGRARPVPLRARIESHEAAQMDARPSCGVAAATEMSAARQEGERQLLTGDGPRGLEELPLLERAAALLDVAPDRLAKASRVALRRIENERCAVAGHELAPLGGRID